MGTNFSTFRGTATVIGGVRGWQSSCPAGQAGTVGAVLHRPTLGLQRRSQRIRPRPVPGPSGLVALAGQRGRCVVDLVAPGPQLEAERRRELEHRRGQGAGRVLVAAVEGHVSVADRLEDGRQGRRGGEVVVHGVAEAVDHRRIGEHPVPGHQRRRPAGEVVELGDALGGVVEGVGRDFELRAVLGAQHEQAVGPGVGGGEQVGQRHVVAERLRHLLAALAEDHAVVQPVPGERVVAGHGLGPLVLVVREGEVVAAAVEVEPVAEQVEGHDGALDVPPRPPGRPG